MDDRDQPGGGAWTNGLLADSYVPLTDLDAGLAPRILTALERARIAAYLTASGTDHTLRLHVAAGERADARTIVAAVLRAAGGSGPDEAPSTPSEQTEPASAPDGTDQLADSLADPLADPPTDALAGVDTDAEFAAIVADWHVDTHEAIRAAERELARDDEDWQLRLHREPAPSDDPWLDDDHYVPPNPPPIPRPTVAVAAGMLLVALAIVLLAVGSELGLTFPLRLTLAVAAIVTATVVFVLRLRKYHDEDDDGAML